MLPAVLFCDSQDKCLSIHIFIQSQMLTLYNLYYVVQFVFSEEYFYTDKYIISYCKPQVTGSCQNLVLQEFNVWQCFL